MYNTTDWYCMLNTQTMDITMHQLTLNTYFITYFVLLSFATDSMPRYSQLTFFLFHTGAPTAYVCLGVYRQITGQQSKSAVMRDQKTTVLSHTTDCRPAWNKCVEPLAVLYKLDLEIDRVERVDSTRLKIDQLYRLCRLAPLPKLFVFICSPCNERTFSWTACLASSVCHSRSCAHTTERIELQFGMLVVLGQCHIVLDGCPTPSPDRPSVTFPNEGHS